MIDLEEFLWNFSVIYFLLDLFQVLRRSISAMALGRTSPSPSSPPPWSSSLLRSPIFAPKDNSTVTSKDRPIDNISSCETILVDTMATNSSPVSISKSLNITYEDSPKENLHSDVYIRENSYYERNVQRKVIFDEICLKSKEYWVEDNLKCPKENYSGVLVQEGLDSVASSDNMREIKVSKKIRKRPTRLVIPLESCSDLDFGEVVEEQSHHDKEFEVEGRDFVLASRRGKRGTVMEDNYGIITDIMGDSKQAFFGVFDGHGGRAAVDYVAENLGKNIVTALREVEKADQLEEAIREGYLITDKGFLSQEVSSGACAATVLLKNGELYVANVGDCRVVLSRKGVADALTSDHHVNREDERLRIENLGAYVNCQNGVWRVQGSLAVSRAIGDFRLKEWIISEPEIKKLHLTSDCEFLVIASDGLWDKVTNQEAVDVISRQKNSIDSCKKLVEISSSRGNKDDVTVMVVDLQNFRTNE